MFMKNQKLAYIYALSAIFLWSTVATAIKITLRYYDPFQLLFVATAVSVVAVGVILAFQGELREMIKPQGKYYWYSAVLGFLNPFLYYVVLLKAYNLLQAQIAQPLNYTWPVMLVLLSVPLLGQKLSWKSLLAILVSFSGVFFISSEGDIMHFEPSDPLGIALAVGSSVIWALFWIFSVRDDRKEAVKLFYNFLSGLIFIAITIPFVSDFQIFHWKGLLAATYLGLFEMGITFFLWLKGMQLTESNDKISNFVYLSPFISLIFIHFILGEDIYYTTLAGLVLIVTGILIQQYEHRQRRRKARKNHTGH